MNSGLFKLSWTDVKSALVYGLVMGLVSMAVTIMNNGSFFGLDLYKVADAGGMAFLGAVVGLIVPLLTTRQGNFVGAVSVKDVY